LQLNQGDWHKLVSRQKTGLSTAFLQSPLGIAACAYSIIIRLRNFLYSGDLLKAHRANAVVLSIGNITVGGTGKTPLVIWLCKFLQQKQIPCAILTRGYKTQGTRDEERGAIDEPAILAESCPQARVIVNPNRVEAAAEAVNKFGAKMLVMDDGFQHRRLARDLDIVTIDATCPFGYGKLLPAGLLREPVASLKRVDAAVLTRCNQVSKSELNQIEKELQLINTNMIIAKSIHNPVFVKSIIGEKIAIEQLRNRKIFAFCGIGNPDAFLSTIKNTGASLVGSKIYNDHYRYTSGDINDINNHANHLEADLILTTQKDWKAIPLKSVKKDIPLAYLAVEIKFIAGEDKLKQLIEGALAGKILKIKEY
jgi:tetraacyldisaccharide 4'-kinase